MTALAVAAAVGLLWTSVTPARTCLYVEGFDPIPLSDVIVAGRVVGSTLAPDVKLQFRNSTIAWMPVRAHITLDRTFKQKVPAEIDVVTTMAVDVRQRDYSSSLHESDCAFGIGYSDLSGQYVVLGLRKLDDGAFRVQYYLFAGPAPQGDQYDRVIARLDSRFGASFPLLLTAVAATLGPLAFLAGTAFVWRRKGGAA